MKQEQPNTISDNEQWQCDCEDPVINRQLVDGDGIRRDYCGLCKKLVRTAK